MKGVVKKSAIRTLDSEARSIKGLKAFIDDDFEKIVHLISDCTGRIVISGIGKSGIIAQKIVATLNSTGTHSVFMHAADAIHGDLGILHKEDIILIISKSGESPEIKLLVPLLKGFGNMLIGMVGATNSFLARQADYILNTTVEQEACPNNLAPTNSTTAQLAMGDALAVCIMEVKGFDSQDFAKFHPGGALGKKLYLRVHDLCADNQKPTVQALQPLKEVIVVISKSRLGATAVVNDKNEVLGIITDGDLRRLLEKQEDISRVKAQDIMTKNPKHINPDALAVDALQLMRGHEITQLVVIKNKKLAGFIHLHDLIKEGLI